MKMADVERFRIGGIISCTDVFGGTSEGEVMAFDDANQIVVIKCAASGGLPRLCDVRMINLQFVEKVVLVREAIEPQKPLTNLNYDKLANRVKNNIDCKMRDVNYVGIGVSESAQKLAFKIAKILQGEVYWKGQEMVVMNEVVISPPYHVDNIIAPADCRSLDLVKRIVEKFYNEDMK